MAKNKKSSTGIDQEALLEAISQGHSFGRQPEGNEDDDNNIDIDVGERQNLHSSKTNSKKSSEFEKTFLIPIVIKERMNVGITKDTHTKLLDMLRLLGVKDVTIAAYVENVLRLHIEDHRDEVNSIINKRKLKNIW